MWEFESKWYDLTDGIRTQRLLWNFLKRPVYAELVKQIWIFASATNLQVTSSMLWHKITTSEKSITKLLSHDRYGKHCLEMLDTKEIMEEIARVIFLDEKPTSNSKNLYKHHRVWFKILLGCIYHKTSTNSSDYINADQKYMM